MNTSGNSQNVVVNKGVVKVVGLTLAGSGSSPKGNLIFGPVGSFSGSTFHAWISTTKDGARVSSSCGYKGYAEAQLLFSTDGSRSCNLSPGGTYYLNLAVCTTAAGDLNCSGSGAKTHTRDAVIAMVAKYVN